MEIINIVNKLNKLDLNKYKINDLKEVLIQIKLFKKNIKNIINKCSPKKR